MGRRPDLLIVFKRDKQSSATSKKPIVVEIKADCAEPAATITVLDVRAGRCWVAAEVEEKRKGQGSDPSRTRKKEVDMAIDFSFF